ncbi:MAG: SUMF1/EgtB/PvdO family nonheme iron enzyme [Phormidesmis sp.]
MSRIFISYRRSDSISEAGRIYDYLYSHFGRDSIFKDVDDIDAGDDFRDRVTEAVGQCQILLAVIGKTWLTAQDAAGNRRLDNPADWVRLEIETALKRKIRVIPVLLDAVEIPAAQLLPEVLRPLAYRNAARVRHDPDFRRDMDRVVGVIQRHFTRLSEATVTAPSPSKPPQVQTPIPVQQEPKCEFEVVTISKIERGFLGLAKLQVITRARKGEAEYRRESLGQGVALDLVVIPGGAFQMGSPAGQGDDDEKPQHRVTVKPFLMGRYQVTQAQWRVVAALPKAARDLNADPSKCKGSSRPVEYVSWDDAVEFCQRLSQRTGREYRLPSEAEWEYACRANTTTPFHFGETLTSELANYDANYTYGSGPKGKYRKETTNVGSFSANAFGLHDMHGNVYEWCLDHWHENYAGAPVDGSAWLSADEGNESRLLRGGSWNIYPGNCRSANRSWDARDNRYFSFGFRVVCASSWTLA